MRKWLPQGGGWTTTVVAFMLLFNFPTFRQGAEELPGKSESRKIAAGKIAAWQGFDLLRIPRHNRLADDRGVAQADHRNGHETWGVAVQARRGVSPVRLT
jgi:hypothetical protein